MIFFAEWIENWNLQNLRSWNGRNGRRSSSHVTFQVVPLPCCWVTFSMLGNVDVWVTRKVALMWQLNLMASTPLEFTSRCMPFSCKHFSRAPRNSSRPILRIQPQWKLQLIMQQIMHGRSRLHAISSWESLSDSFFLWDWFRNLTFGSWEKIDMCFDFGKLLVAVFLGSLCPVLS